MQLHSYNSTESSYSETLNSLDIQDIYSCKPPQRLHYFWERQCDISPDAIALICEKEFTYRELDTQANQLANYFVQKGIGTGNRIGILLTRSPYTYITLLAILKCGAAFVPLDPSFPEDRVAFIAENASLDLLVTTSQQKEAIINVGCSVLMLDQKIDRIIATESKERINIPDTEDDLCYIIYTSGSTGRPKGVAVNHSNICNFLTVCTPIYGVTSKDRVYQGMIIAFDFSIEEIWPTFVVGATLVAGPTDHRRLGADLTDFLIEQKITVLYCVPTLSAASLVSQLREQPEFTHVSMLDIYQCPTIADLAARLKRKTAPTQVPDLKPPFYRVSRKRYFIGATIQALGLIVIFFCFALQWLLPYLTYTWTQEDNATNFESVIAAIVALSAIIPLMLGFSIVAKWLLLGQVKPGKYRLWGSFYLRWWFVKTLFAITPHHFLSGTPWLNLYYRLLGAKIGTNVYLSAVDIAVPDLVSIGADTNIGYSARLVNSSVEKGWLTIGRIEIGDRCFVGASSILSENTIMENDSHLEDLSMLPAQQQIPDREVWAGSPAAKVGTKEAGEQGAGSKGENRPGWLRRTYFAAIQGLLLMTLPILELAPILPGVEQMYSKSDETHWLIFSPLIALSFVIFMMLQIAILKWLIVGRVQPGQCRLDSYRYVRLWYVDKLMELSLDIIRPLYATLYLQPWYRLLGSKLGSGAEISTPSSLIPDLVTIGSESFIADGVVMGVPRVEGGRMYLYPTHIGKRAFIGNSALLPAGITIGDDTLIGCMSIPPTDVTQAAKPDTAWFGSPGIFLPQRQIVEGFSIESTYQPSLSLVLQRLTIEAVRILFPLTCIVVLSSLLIDQMLRLDVDYQDWQLMLFLPFLYFGFGLAMVVITIISKWAIIGRYKPTERPLWSRFVFRSELVTCIHETLAVPFLVAMLRGTPFINWYLRLMGCKIGNRVFTDTADITEFDIISVGNDAALNGDCGLQTHLFEDRVMKISTVTIGDRCSVGSSAIVLYDTVMENDSSLGNLSMLMKGESLPAASSWVGSPARTTD